jgi:hypothetical protein
VDTATLVIITGFITSLLSIVVAVLTNLQTVKKSQFEAMEHLIEQLQEQVDRQKIEIDELRAENAALRAQLRELGQEPNTKPRRS